MDVTANTRHPECVGEQAKYWDHRECCWVPYDAALEAIPVQPSADEADAEDATAVEPVR